MSGFAYAVQGGKVETPILKDAPGAAGDLVWVHLVTNDERAKLWLGGEAKLTPHVIEALTAAETRPRCDAIGDGALINLRGLSSEISTASDPLASIRMYAHGSRVFSVTRKQLNALAPVRVPMSARIGTRRAGSRRTSRDETAGSTWAH